MRLPDAKMPLRVTLVLRRWAPGQYGVERLFREVSDAMPPDIEATLVEVPFPSRGVVPRLRNMLFTARLQADVVHVTGDIQYCALAVRSRRCVLTVLDLASARRLSGWRRKLLVLVWYRLPVRRATTVTTISRAVYRELIDLLPEARGKTTVIECPVGREFTSPPESPIRSEPSQVLLVGSSPNKNLEKVVTAIASLPVHVHVVGVVSEAQRRLMDGLGISYSCVTGLSDAEMVETYRRSSVLVFASTYEGFGLPIAEAQACGVPVVTSDLAPMRDVAGDGAVLVDPHDPGSIRSAVEALLVDDELRSKLVDAGRSNTSRYAMAEIAGRYAATYRRLTTDSLLVP